MFHEICKTDLVLKALMAVGRFRTTVRAIGAASAAVKFKQNGVTPNPLCFDKLVSVNM